MDHLDKLDNRKDAFSRTVVDLLEYLLSVSVIYLACLQENLGQLFRSVRPQDLHSGRKVQKLRFTFRELRRQYRNKNAKSTEYLTSVQNGSSVNVKVYFPKLKGQRAENNHFWLNKPLEKSFLKQQQNCMGKKFLVATVYSTRWTWKYCKVFNAV